MKLSSRNQLLKEAEQTLQQLREMEEITASKKVVTLAKKMEELMKKNKQSEALGELAKFFGDKKMEKVLKSLGDIEKEMKTLPYGLGQFRTEVATDLLALAKQRLNGKEYEMVYLTL